MENSKSWIVHQVERHIVKPVYHGICRQVIKRKKDSSIALFESEHNCGFKNDRMTERGFELALARDVVGAWKSSGEQSIIEVGAVTPYYFPGMIKDILDAYDSHELVNYKMDLLDYDFTGKNVLSISTIEHVGTGDYNLEKKEDAVFALNKLLKESKHCLITWPIGYNKKLDKYVLDNLEDTYLECYYRGIFDNCWKREQDCSKIERCKYSHMRWADMVGVIKK